MLTEQIRARTYAILERSDRTSRLGRIIDLSLIFLIAINVVAVIIETVQPIYEAYAPLFRAFNIFSVLVFTIEYALRVWSSVERVDELGNRRKRLDYILSPMAVIDLLAFLPFYLSFLFPLDLRFLRVMRLLRVFKITRYSSAMNMLLNVFRVEAHALFAALSIWVVTMILAACATYLLEHPHQPEDFASIPHALWWVVITITTVGFGDVVPVTAAGKMIGGVVSVSGVFLAAAPAGILASGLSDQLRRNRERITAELRRTYQDGEWDEMELRQLEYLRRDLGLPRHVLEELRESVWLEAHAEQDACPHCGKSLAKLKP